MGNVIAGAFPGDVLTAAEAEVRGFGLGDRYVDHLGREFVFVEYGTGGATGAGYVVSINEANLAVMATSTVSLFGQRVGTAQAVALVDQYGWVQIYGASNVQTGVAAVAVQMATTATAGQVDDVVTTGTKDITGLSLTTAKADAAGLAPAWLNYPIVGETNA